MFSAETKRNVTEIAAMEWSTNDVNQRSQLWSEKMQRGLSWWISAEEGSYITKLPGIKIRATKKWYNDVSCGSNASSDRMNGAVVNRGRRCSSLTNSYILHHSNHISSVLRCHGNHRNHAWFRPVHHSSLYIVVENVFSPRVRVFMLLRMIQNSF